MKTARDTNPIGVFDSGVGGLTVVRELRKHLPNEGIIYFGDTARAPYGGMDTETLITRGREIINFFLTKRVKAIVIACGTSSSTSHETLCREFSGLPIIDTIRPGAQATVELITLQPGLKPVFIATAATIKSGLFARLVGEKLPKLEMFTRACPLFAPMVEAGLALEPANPLLAFSAENYLSDLRGKVNALILGCTHYPLLIPTLTRVLGEITFINPATATALAAKKAILPAPDTIKKPPVLEYYSSGDAEQFAKMAKYILNEECIATKISF